MRLEAKPLPVPQVIAIDGPVASGKSSVGGALAERLGYRFIDTGLMYRAITALALERHLDPEDETALTALADATEVDITPGSVRAGGVDITDRLFTAEVELAVSLVSRVAGVRRALVAQQQRMARAGGIVMVGRDIGTKVLPEAPAKVFLEASIAERARRRHQEQQDAGRGGSLGQVRADLERRDALDSERAESPLRAAPEAVRVDTDGLSVEGVVQRVIDLVSTG